MKVWVLQDHYLDIEIYSEDTDVFEIPLVKEELSYLTHGIFLEEKKEFIALVDIAKRKGYGSAEIEERFTLELKEVNE